MGHLVEEFAKHCGVKISRPEISDHFFPIVFEKYIIVARSGDDSMSYSYWREVLSMINPTLKSSGIKVLQINVKDGSPIQYIDMMLGGISYPQISYLIKNSLCVFGESSVVTQIASMYDKPIVSLHSKYFSENDKPYWGTNFKALEPHRKNCKPSFSDKERPRSIDSILPEEIAASILKKISLPVPNLNDSIFIGSSYLHSVNELCPDFFNPSILNPSTSLNIRLDWHNDLEMAAKWFYGRKVNLFMDQPMRIEPLVQFKQSINQINFFIDLNTDINYIEEMVGTGIKLQLLTKNIDNIKEVRLKFIDYIVEEYRSTSKKDIDNHEKLCDNSSYTSSKNILSQNKVYPSRAAMLLNIPKSGEDRVIDTEEFWEELNHYYIYNK